jgi:hypothetical protein
MDLIIAAKAEELEIVMFCLPSNTTHELQPLDHSCFNPVETAWDIEVQRFWDSLQDDDADRSITKVRFQHIFSKVWDIAMTSQNAKSGK